MDRWLVMMESHYLESNPYHNSTHAADVLAVSIIDFLHFTRTRVNMVGDVVNVVSSYVEDF